MNPTTNKNLSSVWTHATDLLIESGRGCKLLDHSGKEYLDFTSGIGVTSTGHCHPKIVEAVKTQSEKLLFGQMNIVSHQPVFDLVEQLKPIMPEGLDTFFFSNSGAEAVEGAIKLAKQATGRSNVVVFQGSFHGRTHLTMSMTTSKTIYRAGHNPLVPGIYCTPYPYAFYYGWDEQTALDFSIRELRKLLMSQTAPSETACIIVEPILGEGGYVVPPAGFLKAVRSICDEFGILMIADEVQSGFGRSGRFFAVEYENISPDIMTMAKGIASGIPLSGIAYRRELDDRWPPGSHGGTYGGNPIACAAGAATIQVLKEEKLVVNTKIRGNQLMKSLRDLQKKYPVIGDVRGRGLMVASEFGERGKPDVSRTKAVIAAAREEGLLLLSCGTFGNIVRWIPPLIVTEEEIDEGLGIFERALERTRH